MATPRNKKGKDELNPIPGNGINPSVCNGTGKEEIKDPSCDPENPVKITFQDVSAAAYKIKDGIHRSPCIVSCIVLEISHKHVLIVLHGVKGVNI